MTSRTRFLLAENDRVYAVATGGDRSRPTGRVKDVGQGPRSFLRALPLIFLSACSANAPSILEPAGPAATRVEGLWWFLFWISVVVFLVVLALMLLAVRRRGRIEDPIADEEPRWGEPFVALSGVVIPWVILTIAFVISLGVMRQLAAAEESPDLTIEVEGRMWWWEVRYPNGAVTSTEIHIPVGERVRVRLTSADVIHSFWVPELQVKIDQIPGRENELWLQADRAGRFRGQCAEYCGLQHANMIFTIVAEPRETFEEWVDNETQPASEPGGAALRGRDVFMNSSCVGCHAIRGTEAGAGLGPDLTHLAGRSTLGSAILPNTRENLSRLITDPQRVKPGVTMPPTSLSAGELNALLDYLEQLD
jgi:cytochrome c oxidase subunit II